MPMTNVLSCPKAGKIGPIRREIIFEPLPDDTVPDAPTRSLPTSRHLDRCRPRHDRPARTPGYRRGLTRRSSWARCAGTGRGERSAGGSRIPEGSLPLASVTQPQVIWTRTLSARCTPPESWSSRCPPPEVADGHTSPSMQCTCGIYAWYAPDDAGMLSARVFGVVEASGLVLMGDSGFRAERARIVAVATGIVASRRHAPPPASRCTGAVATCSRTTPAMTSLRCSVSSDRRAVPAFPPHRYPGYGNSTLFYARGMRCDRVLRQRSSRGHHLRTERRSLRRSTPSRHRAEGFSTFAIAPGAGGHSFGLKT